MVNNQKSFVLPDDLADKISPSDHDPIQEAKAKKEKEAAELADLYFGVKEVLENTKLQEACKDGSILVKKDPGLTEQNLYLGYADAIVDGMGFCFFRDWAGNTNTDKKTRTVRLDDICFKLHVSNNIRQDFDIHSSDELYKLVIAAVTAKYQKASQDITNENLKEVIK